MRLVRILKYFWMNQKPKVDIMEQTAWVIPRYVIWRNEKETVLFWIIDTRDPEIHAC